MLIVQYVAVFVIGVLMVYTLNKYREGTMEIFDLIFWEVLLLGLILVSIFTIPITDWIKHVLGIKRGLDVLFIGSIGLLYLITFRIYLAVDRTEREITELTRKVAIELEEIREKLEEIEKKLK